MLQKIYILCISIIVPYLLFNVVVLLNEQSIIKSKQDEKKTNFDIKKQAKIKSLSKPKLKAKPKKTNTPLPSIKPSSMKSNLDSNVLSFGLSSFQQANFDEFEDNDLLNTESNQVMSKESVDSIPSILKRSPIVYPELARKQGVNGYVLLNVLIDEKGRVDEVAILDSKPKEIFDIQASNSVRKWTFRPATYLGKTVKVWATQKIVFRLD